LAGLEANMDYLEELINKQEPIEKVLRLMVLLSLTNGGIKQKNYEFFKREIVQTYGFEYVFVLNNLEKLQLFKKQEGKNNYNVLRKQLNLIVEDTDENNPTDISFVYSGYAPMSVRLIQQAFKPGGWKGINDVMKLVPGPTVEEVQALPHGVQANDKGANQNPVTLVLFIGGVTFTELSALRWLSRQQGQYGDIICATTNMVNGNSFFANVR